MMLHCKNKHKKDNIFHLNVNLSEKFKLCANVLVKIWMPWKPHMS